MIVHLFAIFFPWLFSPHGIPSGSTVRLAPWSWRMAVSVASTCPGGENGGIFGANGGKP